MNSNNDTRRQADETKNRHHDLSGSSLVVSGSLEGGVVARGGRLEQARGCQRQVVGRKHLPGSSSADQPPSLHAPTSTDDAKCCRPAIGVMWRATFAKRGRWEESGLGGSALDPLVGALKEDKMDSSSPRYIAHAAATQAPRTSKIKQEWRTRPKDRETSVDEPKRIQVDEAPPHRQTSLTKTTDPLQGPPLPHAPPRPLLQSLAPKTRVA